MTTIRKVARAHIKSAEQFLVLSGCDKCDKKAREIDRVFKDGGIRKTHEERMKRIKNSGLPTMIISERKKQDD